jgi:anti-sigma factor RsiW
VSIPESHLAQEAIAALVDGELPAGPAGRAARHLSGCAECRMAVQAQREAKDALHCCDDVTVPGDLLSRLRAIPFTADVPGSGGLGSLTAEPGRLTMTGPSGAWAVPLAEPGRPGREPGSRWFRRGVAGTLAGLGLGVTALALSLPANDLDGTHIPTRSVADPAGVERHTEVVPPVVRTLHGGTASTLHAPTTGGTP